MPEKGDKGGAAVDLKGALATMVRSLGIGTAGGGALGIVAYLYDPRSPAAMVAWIGGSIIGFSKGMSEVILDHRKGKRAADSEPNYQAKLAAERELAACRADKEELRSKIQEMGQQIRKLELDVSMYHTENQGLRADVLDLARRLTDLDGHRHE